MREHGILFSGEMVRAILDGRKTQTRRIVKPPFLQQYKLCDRTGENFIFAMARSTVGGYVGWDDCSNLIACPYGVPGDRLFVKETWRPFIVHCCGQDTCDCDDVNITYAADGYTPEVLDQSRIPADWCLPKAAKRGNVSPLCMPQWASRITLELTGVRVERLQDISEADAEAEGCEPSIEDSGGVTPWGEGISVPNYRYGYAELWDRINGPDSWAANPHVWVLSFKRIEEAGNASR